MVDSILSEADVILDRRRLRRKLSFWRILAVVSLIIALGIGGAIITKGPLGSHNSNQIARISVSGLIVGSKPMRELLSRLGTSSQVKGVIVTINSPGGTTTGSEQLFRDIRALAEKKPVVAVVDGTAASGAYIAALATDHIVARETSIVGSIGVIMQYPNVTELLDKVGVKFEEIKSSPLKAEPSGLKPTSPEARAAIQAIINDGYTWFKNLVATRRNLNATELTVVADGRVFSGRQGVALKLIDQLGDEKEAVAWLENQKNIAKDLPVRDWKPENDENFSLFSALAYSADFLGYSTFANNLRRTGEQVDVSKLDGLLSLWQLSVEN